MKNPSLIKITLFYYEKDKHSSCVLPTVGDFSFEGLKLWLSNHDVEGIVFHNYRDGRMCKIRKTDFGIKRL